MPELPSRQRHFKIEGKFSAIYSQVTENKQKIPVQNFSDYQIPLPLPPQLKGGSSLLH